MSDEGLLWLINRAAFHPRGFALAFHKNDEGVVEGWSMLGNGSEVWTFTSEADDEEFAKSSAFLASLKDSTA